MKQDKYNLEDFQKDFPDEDACLEYIFKERFNTKCKCGHGKMYRVTKRKCFACSVCGRQVYPLVGTIYERSTTPLTSWFYGLFLISQSRGVIPAKALERQLGITYKTAWRMKKLILKSMRKKNHPGLEMSVQ